MRASDEALALLHEFEQGPNGGFAASPYLCPAGKRTVGWGHVVRSTDHFSYPISAEMADDILADDLDRFVVMMAAVIRKPLRQCMLDALVCFVFNVGFSAFSGSTLLHKLNGCDYAGAADELLRWNKARDPKTGARVELAGLTRRRKAERDLFLRDGVHI